MSVRLTARSRTPAGPTATSRIVTPLESREGKAAMKKLWTILLGILMVLAASVTAAAPVAEAAARPYCGIWWGSLAKTGAGPAYPSDSRSIYDVRTGRHACYDRLVVDVSGSVGPYNVGYVRQITSEGSGFPVPTRGGAALQISVMNPAYNIETGEPTYVFANPHELTNVAGYRTFRQVVWGGTFEGYTTIGIGVRARLPFRVFVLTGPGNSSRLIVDVAHRWW